MSKPTPRISTDMKLMMEKDSHKIAEILIDGCNMGVKSLSRYLNEYKRATNEAKSVANRLIGIEQKLNDQIRQYL